MKKKLTFISPIAIYLILPSISFGANCNMSNLGTLKDLIINVINCFLNPIVALLVSFSVVIFLWGVFKFIKSAGDEKNKQGGKELMFWGIIGIFVIVSLWGLVAIFQGTFQFSGNENIIPRKIPLNL